MEPDGRRTRRCSIQIQESNDENEEFSDTADSNGSFTDYNNFAISDADGGVEFHDDGDRANLGSDRAGSGSRTSISFRHGGDYIRDGYRWHHRKLWERQLAKPPP